MKKSYPTWLVPRTHTIGLDYKTVRARLGAQAVNSKLTEKQLARRGIAAPRKDWSINKRVSQQQLTTEKRAFMMRR